MRAANDTISPVWAAMVWLAVGCAMGYDLLRVIVFGIGQVCDPSHVLPELSTKL